MNIERAKVLLPLIKAYAEGKSIQCSHDGIIWLDVDEPTFSDDSYYRVKPEKQYRPFKDRRELLLTMTEKNITFGWVRFKTTAAHSQILYLSDSTVVCANLDDVVMFSYNHAFENLTFLDGTPFGVKED